MDGAILSYTGGQVNANGSRWEIHAAQKVLEARVGVQLLEHRPGLLQVRDHCAGAPGRRHPPRLCGPPPPLPSPPRLARWAGNPQFAAN